MSKNKPMTREEMRAELDRVEQLRKDYIQMLLEQRAGIDKELEELGYREETTKRKRAPMSEETKQKMREAQQRRRAGK